MVAFAVENLGACSDDETAALVAAGDAKVIGAVLADLGYTLVPEDPLWADYTGTIDPGAFGVQRATWWTRFFDYL